MNWLLHNPLGDLPGPAFLLLYVVIIGLTIVACVRSIRAQDRTDDTDLPRVPTKPDPIVLAYLRGGRNEVARLLIVELIQRGYLEVHEARQSEIRQTAHPPDLALLSKAEADTFRHFQTPRRVSAVFQPGGLAWQLDELYGESQRWALAAEGLLVPDSGVVAAKTWGLGTAAILLTGGYKLAVALAKGRHNVGILIGLSVLGLLGLVIACALAKPRTTRRGRAYLERLRLAFGETSRRTAAVPSPGAAAALPLMLGLFGLDALAGSPHAGLSRVFARANPQAGSGTTSAGCGAASGCGGGGGGGCGGGGGGGCGGGGCGGCGGG
jgi:uncharacterized protein (TIGR04222 family)